MARSESTKEAEKKYDQFALLYQKFKAGCRWLDAQIDAGKDVCKDTEEFMANVTIPLSALWESFTPEEKKALESVMHVYDQAAGKRMTFSPMPAQQQLAV
jgi:hypothetical protein